MNVLEMFRLDGKLAIVTGGSGQYGRQMALALAQAGAKVCIACLLYTSPSPRDCS